MFISVLDLFKIGIGPSSSHTMGPMSAALAFRALMTEKLTEYPDQTQFRVHCILKGSLAYTGKGHGTDRAVVLGLHGYEALSLGTTDIDSLIDELNDQTSFTLAQKPIHFDARNSIEFDCEAPLKAHPNGMIFQLYANTSIVLSETYFSIGGGFIHTQKEMEVDEHPIRFEKSPFPFDSATNMLNMAKKSGLNVAEMKLCNEETYVSQQALNEGLDEIWHAMKLCIENGLKSEGTLPGGLNVKRRACSLFRQLEHSSEDATINDWLCAYAMAVNEENAAGHRVVTAPTNGAAGVLPAVLYYQVTHKNASRNDIHNFLLSAAAIGGIIKHRSSISGAEVGCQGEVGSAAAMAAAGLCSMLGGTAQQIENAAEIALEHHLGLTCDPVGGLVQIPCIERNGFGAIKAFTSATLAKRGTGQHLMPLDNCISAMKQTGIEMSEKYKETSLGGLAVNYIEC